MKLFYTPGACSQAPHIALREANMTFDLEKTDIRAKKLEDGSDYLAINPKGSVPAIQLGDGTVLTENAAILIYIGDLAPESGLLPSLGDFDRYRVLELLVFITTEVHKGFGPLWKPGTSEDLKAATRQALGTKFDFLQERLGAGPYLMGDRFTLPDAYAFVVLNWTGMHGIDLGRWPALTDYVARIAQRPAVNTTLEVEGLKRAG